jgi:hypothetical protein
MAELTRGERLQIMLTDNELETLDTWRFAKRMPSRASAVRELLRRGLVAEGFPRSGAGTKSKDFGVVDFSSKARRAHKPTSR